MITPNTIAFLSELLARRYRQSGAFAVILHLTGILCKKQKERGANEEREP